MIAILLVGGFGTRLRPLTLSQPKGLLPVLNRPFLAYQLDLLKEAGVSDVVLAAGAHARQWEKALRTVTPKSMRLHFAYEPAPLGTGGAVRFAYDFAKRRIRDYDRSTLVFNGDVFFEVDLKKFISFHDNRHSLATVALTKVSDPTRFGLVGTDKHGRIRRFVEKPNRPIGINTVNAGVYLFDNGWIEEIPKGRVVSIERETFPESLARGDGLYGFLSRGYWNDIGTHATYLQAHKDLLYGANRWTRGKFLRKRGLHSGARVRLKMHPAVSGRAVIGDRSSVGANVSFQGFVCIGKDVTLADGCTLSDCVVMDGAHIGASVKIAGSIIGPRCRIGEFAEISQGKVLGEGAVLPPYTKC